jgi:predicted ATPase
LLPAGQQTLFRRLGVFADSFSLEAACAIAPDVGMTPAQLTTALVALVSKSMVVADAGPGEHAHADAGAGGHAAAGRVRYRLLATARAYAVEQLAQAAPPVLVADGYAASRMHSV